MSLPSGRIQEELIRAGALVPRSAGKTQDEAWHPLTLAPRSPSNQVPFAPQSSTLKVSILKPTANVNRTSTDRSHSQKANGLHLELVKTNHPGSLPMQYNTIQYNTIQVTSDYKAPFQLAYPGNVSPHTEPLPTALQIKRAADRFPPMSRHCKGWRVMGELSYVAY